MEQVPVAKNGRILINGDKSLSKAVQTKLLKCGYKWASGSKQVKPIDYEKGAMYGICFYTLRKRIEKRGKVAIEKHKLMNWTSNPRIFSMYSGRLVTKEGII